MFCNCDIFAFSPVFLNKNLMLCGVNIQNKAFSAENGFFITTKLPGNHDEKFQNQSKCMASVSGCLISYLLVDKCDFA